MIDLFAKGEQAVESASETQDSALISLVRSGDHEAFGILFERHREAALRVGIRLTAGTRISAEDCVADAFAQTLAALQRGHGPDEFFRAYLYTVMRHAVEAANKADARSVTVDDFEVIENASNEHGVDPAITRFETEVVRNAFAALPERWQSVLWYSDIEGMKPAEVGPILGMSSHAVSMLRTRAREGLRTAYLQGHISSVAAGSSCATIASQLGAFSRLSLAKRDRAKVEQHLAGCADCKAMSAELTNVNRGLVGIIALIFLGAAGDDLFGGLRGGGGAPPAIVSANTDGVVTTAAFRPQRLAAVLGAAAIVVILIVLVVTGIPPAGPLAADTASSSEDSATKPGGTSGLDGQAEPGRADHADTEPTRPPFGAEFTPDDPAGVPTNPPIGGLPAIPPVAPAVPVNLLANGGFDGPGIEAAGGNFTNGTVFDGWVIGPPSGANPALVTLKVWYETMGAPGTLYASPFPQGSWPRIMGSISQTFPTEIGKTYLLEYQTRASGSDANGMAAGWAGGNQGFVRINGVQVDNFATVATPLYSPRSLEFVATQSQTQLSFSNTPAGGAVGIDTVSVTLVP